MIKPLSKENQLKKINQNKKSKKKLKKECDDLWREIVKKRAGYKCEFPNCHRREPHNRLNAHHYFSKGAYSHLRHDPENGICLCVTHHTFGPEAAHKDPNFKDNILGKRHYRAIRSQQWHDLLERKAGVSYKSDLNAEKLYLEKELQNLEKSSNPFQ